MGMVLLHVLLPFLFDSTCNKVAILAQNPSRAASNSFRVEIIYNFEGNKFFTPNRVIWMNKYIGHVREIVMNLQKLHLAFFYLQGTYYDFAKRVFGISYVNTFI
jgi:hypothetical protein